MSIDTSRNRLLNALNVVEFQLVDILRSGNDTEVIAELVLLQELFREIFQVPLREGDTGRDGDLSIT